MRIVIFCKGIRGRECLRYLCKEGADILMIVLEQGESRSAEYTNIAQKCRAEVRRTLKTCLQQHHEDPLKVFNIGFLKVIPSTKPVLHPLKIELRCILLAADLKFTLFFCYLN